MTTHSSNPAITLPQLATLWFLSRKPDYAESTFRGLEGSYNGILVPLISDRTVQRLSPLDIQQIKNQISETHSASTTNKALLLLSMIVDFAVSPLHLLESNPCKEIRKSRVTPKPKTTWTEAQIRYFLSLPEVQSSVYFEMFLLSFSAGLRPGEVCGMFTTDLNPDQTISLERGLNKYGNLTDMKTHQSHRRVAIYPQIFETLQKKAHSQGYTGNEPAPFLFTFPNRAPITPGSYSRAFRNMILKHNSRISDSDPDMMLLPLIRLYDCRHSFATNTILGSQENVKVISEIMGDNVETVLRNYVHTMGSEHRNAIANYSSRIL